MPYLTETDIYNIYKVAPNNRMTVVHNIDWWSEINDYSLPEPIRLQFDENIRNIMPEPIKTGKGIYMFVIEPNHSFAVHIDLKHLMYVGRVQGGTTNFNFFKRFNDYVSAIGNRASQRNKMRLTNLWPNIMYVYFFELSDRTDESIRLIENNIIQKIIPPLNEALSGDARLTRQFY